MRKHWTSHRQPSVLKRIFVLGILATSLSACSALSLVSIPLQMAMSNMGEDKKSENQTAQNTVQEDASTGPISVATLLARARGEEDQTAPDTQMAGDMLFSSAGADTTNTQQPRRRVSIRLNYAAGEKVTREAAKIWLGAHTLPEGQPIWIIAASDGAPDNPSAVYKGITRAIQIKAWLDASDTPAEVTFDAAAEPGTVLLSLEQPTWVRSDA